MRKIKEFQSSQGLSADGVIGPITLNALRGKLNLTKEQLANFMGQSHVETGGFEADTESLNYSSANLVENFSYYKNRPGEAYIDGRTAQHRADQETIANKVYWDRNRSKKYWLGNPQWGDGWKFRGRGISMTTGGYNYKALGDFLKKNLLDHPELVATEYYWESGLFYYRTKNLWGICKEVSIESMREITKIIQGGDSHLDKRMRWTRRYLYLQNKQP